MVHQICGSLSQEVFLEAVEFACSRISRRYWSMQKSTQHNKYLQPALKIQRRCKVLTILNITWITNQLQSQEMKDLTRKRHGLFRNISRTRCSLWIASLTSECGSSFPAGTPSRSTSIRSATCASAAMTMTHEFHKTYSRTWLTIQW